MLESQEISLGHKVGKLGLAVEKSTIDTVASNNVRQFTPLSIAKSRYPGLVTKLFSAYQSCNRLLLATCVSRMPDHTVVATRRESIITIITFLDFSGLKRTVKRAGLARLEETIGGVSTQATDR